MQPDKSPIPCPAPPTHIRRDQLARIGRMLSALLSLVAVDVPAHVREHLQKVTDFAVSSDHFKK